jgi:hypothetical protein
MVLHRSALAAEAIPSKPAAAPIAFIVCHHERAAAREGSASLRFGSLFSRAVGDVKQGTLGVRRNSVWAAMMLAAIVVQPHRGESA